MEYCGPCGCEWSIVGPLVVSVSGVLRALWPPITEAHSQPATSFV